MSLSGLVALVTGGASGIGAAAAVHFGALGARVAVADRNLPEAERIAAASGADAMALAMDVAEARAVRQGVDAVRDRLGGLDILVHCAGVLLNQPFLTLEAEAFDRVMQVNLAGTFHVGQAAARAMVGAMAGRGGRIINIASVAALLGVPGRAAYAASKGGVISLTRVMALELAPHGILVNAIAPGPVDTPMTQQSYDPAFRAQATAQVPLGRFAEPREIAEVAAFLASPAARFVTGQVIVADGGMSSVRMALQSPAGT